MRRALGPKNDIAGFSLTEAVVSCLVITIAGWIATSVYSGLLPSFRLKAAARDLYSNMQQTRIKAIKTNTNCSISYSLGPDRYELSGVTKTVTLRDYGSGVRFQGPQGQTFAVSKTTFNPRGTCNAGYVYLTDEKNTAFYRVGPWSSGIIQMQTYPSKEWPLVPP